MEERLSPFQRVYRVVDDAWNPVLVKEVREALRGRFFTYGFIISLTFAGFLTAVWATSGEDPSGRTLYGWLMVCLGVYNFLFIPLATFRSLASEGEDGRLDHLLLTRMGAVGIVLGKLCAAMVQVGLCLMAFAPFLLMSGLARGIDAVQILQGILGHVSVAMYLSSAGLAGALMAHGAFGRLGWQAVLVGLVWFGSALRFQVVTPGILIQTFSARLVISNLLVTTSIATFFLAIAAVRVQSQAENRSTTLRIGVSIAMGILACGLLLEPSPAPYMRVFQGVLGMVLLALPALVLVTESPELNSRERHWIRTHPRVPAMYAPGRDTAVLFVCVHLLLVLAAVFAVPVFSGMLNARLDGGVGALLGLPLILCVYWLLPSSLMSRMSLTARGRTRLRLLIVALIPISFFAPPLILFFFGLHSTGVKHILNPFHVLTNVFWEGEGGPAAALWLALSVPTLLVLLWRIRNGLQEVRALRRS